MFQTVNRIFSMASALALLSGAAITAHANDTLHFINDNGSTNVDVTYLFNSSWKTEQTAAGEYNFNINGSSTVAHGFCTDLFDNISNGDTWPALKTTTSDPVNGLGSVYYANGTDSSIADNLLSMHSVHAIDYIIEKYAAAGSADAQLAIWDLSVNSQITHTGSVYAWGSGFSAVNHGSGSYSDMVGVYNIEQTAFANNYRSWGSIFENANPSSPRKQDIAFASTPEAGSIAGFMSMVGIGFLPLLRRKKRA